MAAGSGTGIGATGVACGGASSCSREGGEFGCSGLVSWLGRVSDRLTAREGRLGFVNSLLSPFPV